MKKQEKRAKENSQETHAGAETHTHLHTRKCIKTELKSIIFKQKIVLSNKRPRRASKWFSAATTYNIFYIARAVNNQGKIVGFIYLSN